MGCLLLLRRRILGRGRVGGRGGRGRGRAGNCRNRRGLRGGLGLLRLVRLFLVAHARLFAGGGGFLFLVLLLAGVALQAEGGGLRLAVGHFGGVRRVLRGVVREVLVGLLGLVLLGLAGAVGVARLLFGGGHLLDRI